jgi:hypothetical protein
MCGGNMGVLRSEAIMPNLKVELAEFVRTFAIQDKPRLMIFLGAGTSARAGIPTATDLIWIFK